MGYGLWVMGYGLWVMRYEIWDMGKGNYDLRVTSPPAGIRFGFGIWDKAITIYELRPGLPGYDLGSGDEI